MWQLRMAAETSRLLGPASDPGLLARVDTERIGHCVRFKRSRTMRGVGPRA